MATLIVHLSSAPVNGVRIILVELDVRVISLLPGIAVSVLSAGYQLSIPMPAQRLGHSKQIGRRVIVAVVPPTASVKFIVAIIVVVYFTTRNEHRSNGDNSHRT